MLRPTSGGFWLENPSRSGGVALNGSEQTIVSPAARWRAAWIVPITEDDQVLAARAFADALAGKANAALVPTFDGLRLSWPVDGYGRVLHPGTTRRRQLDGTAFADPAIPAASEILATVNANAGLNATQIAINVTQGEPLKAGQFFGIGERLHRIKALVGAAGTVQSVAIVPPLRAAAPAGTVVRITRPVCRMKQVADDGGIGTLDMLRFADVTLEFREDF